MGRYKFFGSHVMGVWTPSMPSKRALECALQMHAIDAVDALVHIHQTRAINVVDTLTRAPQTRALSMPSNTPLKCAQSTPSTPSYAPLKHVRALMALMAHATKHQHIACL